MTQKLASHLFHLMRGASRSESLGRLQRDGHREVAVLRFADLEAMLGRSIEQALAAVGVDLDEQTLGQLGVEARAQFVALRTERDQLRLTVEELTRQQRELSRNRTALRSELHHAEDELVGRERAGLDPEAEADLAELRRRLADGLRSLLSDTLDETRLEQVLTLAFAAVDAHRDAAVARQLQRHDARVEQLRRRIERLHRKLEESEDLLSRARDAARQEASVVVASEPQDTGRPLDDPARRLLLEEIFNLNLELRRMSVSPPPKRVTRSRSTRSRTDEHEQEAAAAG